MFLEHDGSREVDENRTEAHWQKKRRLHLLADCKVDQNHSDDNHNKVIYQVGVHIVDFTCNFRILSLPEALDGKKT